MKAIPAFGLLIAKATGYVLAATARAIPTVVKRILIGTPSEIVMWLRADPASGLLIAMATGNVSTAAARASQTAEQTSQLILASLTTKSDDWHETAGCSHTRQAPAYQVNQDLL